MADLFETPASENMPAPQGLLGGGTSDWRTWATLGALALGGLGAGGGFRPRQVAGRRVSSGGGGGAGAALLAQQWRQQQVEQAREAEAADYQHIERALGQAMENNPTADPAWIIREYQNALGAQPIRTPAGAKAALGVISTFRDKALARQRDMEVAAVTSDALKAAPKDATGFQIAGQIIAAGQQAGIDLRKEAIDIGRLYDQGFDVSFDNGIGIARNRHTGEVQQFGSRITNPAPGMPGQQINVGPEGPQAAPIPGSQFPAGTTPTLRVPAAPAVSVPAGPEQLAGPPDLEAPPAAPAAAPAFETVYEPPAKPVTEPREPSTEYERAARALVTDQLRKRNETREPTDAEVYTMMMALKNQVAAAGAGARAQAVADVQLDQPLGLDANTYRRPLDRTSPPATMTVRQAMGQGYLKTTPQQNAALSELDKARGMVGNLYKMADQLITATTPVEAGQQYLVLHGGALTRQNPIAAAYLDDRDAFLGNLSRSVAAERGVLTDRDIGRMSRSLPSFGDTKAVKDLKRAIFDDVLTTAQETTEREIFGLPRPEGYRRKLDTALEKLDKLGAASGAPSTAAPSGAPGRRQVNGRWFKQRPDGKWVPE